MYQLRKLRKDKGLSMKELGIIVGVAESTISLYENNKRQPDNVTLGHLADFFGVSVDYLLGREETKNPPNVYDVDGLVHFEEIGTICAGYDGSLNETFTGEIVEIPLSMINGEEKEDYFVLRVQGNSMHPRILEGDRILCKRCSIVDSGSFAVVLYDGECATVKKVHYVNGANWIELVPINPEYTTKRIEGADLEQFRILGKVVKLIRDL
jgi:repressor LexA